MDVTYRETLCTFRRKLADPSLLTSLFYISVEPDEHFWRSQPREAKATLLSAKSTFSSEWAGSYFLL